MQTTALVPLYTDPGEVWDALIAAVTSAAPSDVLVIANPNSGPDTVPRADYAAGIAALRAAGIAVAGYVSTRYGARATDEVASEIAAWQAWYGIDAIFFDEVASAPEWVAHYREMTDDARACGIVFGIGNPGTVPDPGYAEIFEVIVMHENDGFPDAASLAATAAFGRERLAAIAMRTPFDAETMAALAERVRFLFTTDAGPGQDYASLPRDFVALLRLVAK